MSVVLTLGTAVNEISVTDPLVLGPIAAFVFIVFVSETIVSGKAYKREVEENARLRQVIERVIPLAEKMVDATEKMLEVTADSARLVRELVDLGRNARRGDHVQ